MTVCTEAVWVNVETTPASQIPARMALHARSRRQRCSTASAAKDSGVRCQRKGAPVVGGAVQILSHSHSFFFLVTEIFCFNTVNSRE